MNNFQPVIVHACTAALPCMCWDWDAVKNEIPPIPPLRKIWTDDTPDWMLGARKLDKENFPMLTDSWQPGNVRGE